MANHTVSGAISVAPSAIACRGAAPASRLGRGQLGAAVDPLDLLGRTSITADARPSPAAIMTMSGR